MVSKSNHYNTRRGDRPKFFFYIWTWFPSFLIIDKILPKNALKKRLHIICKCAAYTTWVRLAAMLALLYNFSTPVAWRSMNMKVHQTLVWLNLLSFGTKDLAEPTFGIQSGFCHGWGLARTASQKRLPITLLRHFVCITPACPLSSCNWALSCSLRATPPPPTD